MAKHPHKLLLVGNKTWKCMLEGCRFFVHLGLAHVLIGMRAKCWECDEAFEVTEKSLQDAKPKCDDCRTGVSSFDLDEWLTKKKLEAMQERALSSVVKQPVEDEEYEHAGDCETWTGGACTCR